VIIVVAQIIPIAPNTNCAPQGSLPELNSALLPRAEANSTEQSPIFVIDQYTGFNSAADTTDGVHPCKESGAEKRGQNLLLVMSTLCGRWIRAREIAPIGANAGSIEGTGRSPCGASTAHSTACG
jgi:hypothetical protein